MKIYTLSFILGAALVLALLNPVSLYSLISGQTVPTSLSSAIWITLSIVIALLIAALLYTLWRDLSLQSLYENDVDLMGQKGGQTEKKLTQNDIYVNSLKEQSRKLRMVSESKE